MPVTAAHLTPDADRSAARLLTTPAGGLTVVVRIPPPPPVPAGFSTHRGHDGPDPFRDAVVAWLTHTAPCGGPPYVLACPVLKPGEDPHADIEDVLVSEFDLATGEWSPWR